MQNWDDENKIIPFCSLSVNPDTAQETNLNLCSNKGLKF